MLSSCQAIVAFCPPVNVDEAVGDVIKMPASAEDAREARTADLKNIFVVGSVGAKKK